MTFRIILAMSALSLIVYFGVIGRRHPLQLGGMMVTFILLFIFALTPELSTSVAHLVGIGRGVDLALYIAIFFLLSFTFNLYLSQREQSGLITRFARTVARSQVSSSELTFDLSTVAVMPMYQEEDVISAVLTELITHDLSVIVIDDGSTDSSAACVQKLIDQGLPIILITHPVNLGQGAALMTGFEEAIARDADLIITFDSDGQHCPQDAKRLAEELRGDTDLDIILGSRFLGGAEGMPTSRKLLLKLATIFTQLSGGPKLTDSHNGLRAIRARALPSLKLTQARMAHASELLYLIKLHQLNFKELPVTVKYTAYSLAKGQSAWGAIQILKDLLIARLTRGR